MKKLVLAILIASYGTCVLAQQAVQPLSQEEYIKQMSRMDKNMKMVEEWSQQLYKGNRDQTSLVEEIKCYAQNHPEFIEIYADHFDTLMFRFNVIDILLIQATMYQAHNQIEDSQRLAIVAVLEQAGIKRTLSAEQVQSLADLAMGKYTEVPGLL